MGSEIAWLNWAGAFQTAGLEQRRGAWNSGWSGEMRRDPEEHRRRRQRPGRYLADTEARKLGEQTGLDTLVVPAVNDVHQVLGGSTRSVPQLT